MPFLAGWEWFILITLLTVFGGTGMVVMGIYLSRWRWPFKVTILEDVAGYGYIPTRNDRARLVPFGDGGEEIFYLKKLKKYRVGYGKRIGKNKIAWSIGNDGYWYNSTFGNLDKKLLEIGVVPVDRDMRFATASLRKGIENRYNEKSFFEKWGVPITIGILIVGILVQGGALWMILDKSADITATTAQSVQTSKEVMELSKQVLGVIDTMKGGSGIKPA